MLTEFASWLESRLQQPLPGAEVQRSMAPKSDLDERFRLKSRENAKPSGVLVLLYQAGDVIHFPLMQRPEYDGAHSGQISLPGGKQEFHDPSIQSAALRETEEEIGIAQDSITIIGNLTDLFVPVSNFVIQPVVGVLAQQPQFVPDPIEVEQIIETDLRQLVGAEAKWKEIVVKRKPNTAQSEFRINAPYYDVAGHVVWGATAMLLAEFRAISQEYFDNIDVFG